MKSRNISGFIDRNADLLFPVFGGVVTTLVIIAEFSIGDDRSWLVSLADTISGFLSVGVRSPLFTWALCAFCLGVLAGRMALFHVVRPVRTVVLTELRNLRAV